MTTNCVAKFEKLSDSPLFGTMAFRRGLENRNSDFRGLNGNDSSTLCRNLVKFGLVTRAFTTLECVQQASIVTGVSLT